MSAPCRIICQQDAALIRALIVAERATADIAHLFSVDEGRVLAVGMGIIHPGVPPASLTDPVHQAQLQDLADEADERLRDEIMDAIRHVEARAA